MGCARHPYEGTVGVCASCVSDRLNKDGSSSDRGRFAKGSSLSEDYFLWKEGASSSSSISKHGHTNGGRIVDTIASLIKTDYAIPTNYERPRSRGRSRREHSSSRAYAIAEPRVSESARMAVLANDDADLGRLNRNDAAKSERDSTAMSKSRDICEITPVEPEREPGQTIHSLLDAEPKSGKFTRSTSKGSPASYFSRSGSRRQSWTVFWRSEKKDEGGRGGAREVLRSVSDAHERATSRPAAFNGVDISDFRSRRNSESSNHYPARSSRRKDSGLSTRHSIEEGCKQLADYDRWDGAADSGFEQQQQRRTRAVASSHSYERNRSWEQLGLAKLPFASVYAAPARNINSKGAGEQRRNRWKMVKKKSEKLEAKVADDHHTHPPTVHRAHAATAFEDDLGQSSGKPTPCTSNCFPQSGGRHILKREDAHLSHEKLRHRRLSIYSYGIMSQPQLTAVDSQLSFTARSRAAQPYTYNGEHRESYCTNGRTAVDYWDGDESISPCDHYVEVSHRRDDGSTGIVDFIPVSEAQKKAYDWVERSKIEGNRSPPRWIEQRADSMDEYEEDDSSVSVSGDINFLGKEELTTVFEQDSESGYGEEYSVGAGYREASNDHQHHELKEEELELEYVESPNSHSFLAVRDSRRAKGKNIVSESEELDEGFDERREQQHFDRNGGEALLSTRSLSDAGSYARDSTDSEIVPARNSLRSLFYMDGEQVIDVRREGEAQEGRAYKPDNAYEEQNVGDWTPDPVDADHRDGQTNNSASSRRSPWKNITMSPSMRRKFLWPRSSPQPHIRRSFEATGNSGVFGSGHHQTSLSFSDTDSQPARPRSPPSTTENTSSNLVAPEGTDGPLPEGLPDTLQEEITNDTTETVLSLVEVEESSPKSSPPRSSISRTSSPQRASLSRSSSKRTLSRCSSRRSRSSSWSSCLTDPAWSSQSAPTKKEENGSHGKEGPFSSLIRLGKKLSRRSSPANNSLSTSPWRGFSKGSPLRGETTST